MAEERLRVEPRGILGKRVRQLRRKGVLPAVIFGHGDSLPVQVDTHEFELGYRRWGRTTLITLTGIDGDIPALVQNVSRDPRSGRLIHADFFRVSLTEAVHATVPLRFVGEPPAVKNLGGILFHQMSEVRVDALPQDIPHRIDIDLSRLETLDDAVHVRDLVVDGAKLKLLDDPDELVVKVVAARVEEVPAPAPAPAAEAEAAATEAAAVGAEAAPAEGAKPAAGQAAPQAPGQQPQKQAQQQPQQQAQQQPKQQPKQQKKT